VEAIRNEIQAFVIRNFLFGQQDVQLAGSDSLMERGIIDSTGVLELVGFLEQSYKISVQDEDIVPENLDSIDALVAFVERRRHTQTSSHAS
jgi:acyl carrier protein